MNKSPTLNRSFYIFIGLLFCTLIYFLAPILTPFLAGAILAYLSDPLVNRLIKLRVPRLLSVIIVFMSLFAVIVLIILLLIPMIQNQIKQLVSVIPSAVAWLQNTILPILKERFGIDEYINIDTLKSTLADNWTKAGTFASWLWQSVLHSGFAFIEWTGHLLLIPVVTFYLLRDWNQVIKGVRGLLPRSIEPAVVKLVKECDEVLSAFFRGQLLVMLSLGVIYSIGLSLMGLQVGLMIGLLAGLMSIVPYLGFIVGIITASIVAYVQFGTMSSVLCVWLVFMVGQVTESTLLVPNLVGNRIGLHPVAVIFSVLAGGTLFGFFGVLLALPVAAVIMVLIRFLHQHYRDSQLYQ